MEFRTELMSKPVEKKLEYSSRALLIGSCFSHNIGDLLKERYFNVLINPFGTVYNPVSIQRQLNNVLKTKVISNNDLVEINKIYCHHDYHSSFNNTDIHKVSLNINEAIEQCFSFIKNVDWIFITLGTSWVYEIKDTNKIVANCHKRPSTAFIKRLLTLEEINSSLDNINVLLKSINPEINLVYTLSPVRHIKDGIEENSLSKALLKVSINNQILKNNSLYFPSYEYIMDDLRDYRFYDEDLIHPNATAIKYIWKKFTETYFSKSTSNKIMEVEKINLFLNHRPFNVDEEFETKRIEKQDELKKLILQS